MERKNLEALTDALTGASPEMSDRGRRVALATYRLLSAGEPLPVRQIAEAAEMSPEEVDGLIDSWPGVFRDSEGDIIGFWGLAIGPLQTRPSKIHPTMIV